MKKLIKKVSGFKALPTILLAVIIVIQSANITRLFVTEKTSYHCDEIYSYGLSNSFYKPFIESDDVYSHENYNCVNEWVSADVFKDYITVSKDQRFRYDSVWYNQSKDRHPPLYYAILHTICSFMPGTFSFWPGFILNLVFFAVLQIFLYLLAKNVLRSRWLALLLCLLWGFTNAATDMVFFTRMYCMLAMWSVILIYLHSRLILNEDNVKPKHIIPLAIVTMLGALTQYLFLFVAFVTAVCFCIRYLLKKRFRLFFAYSAAMLSGVLLSFSIYPAAVKHLFTEGDNASGVDFTKQLVIALRYCFSDIFLITDSDAYWLLMVIPPLLLIFAIFFAPVIFLFRDKPMVKNTFARIKIFFAELPGKIKGFKIIKIISALKGKNPIPAIIMLVSAAVIIITSYTVPFLLGFANRYLFVIYPLFTFAVFALLYFIFHRTKAAKSIMTFLTIILLCHFALHSSMRWLWTVRNPISLHDTIRDKNAVVIMFNPQKYDVLSINSYEFSEANNLFITDLNDLGGQYENLLEKTADGDFYAVINYFFPIEEDESGQYMKDIYENKIYIDELLKPMYKYSGKSKNRFVGECEYPSGAFAIYYFPPATVSTVK